MISTSPLRYPGGKARFTHFIFDSIKTSGEAAEVFVEPFCGGAGASIALLESKKIKRIALNDIDPLVASFWKVVFGKSCKSRDDIQWLVDKVELSDISVDEWIRQRNYKPQNVRELAWKCLFMNRTSFNGILHKSGPIGGWKQENRLISVRFNREKIVQKLKNLYDYREQVDCVENLGWREFCGLYQKTKLAYLYMDPPYYHRAPKLYEYVFDKKMHLELRDYLVSLLLPWMLSYDDAPEVRELYSDLTSIYGCVIDQTYSANPIGGNSFIGRELFFSNRVLSYNHGYKPNLPHVGMSVVGPLTDIPSLGDGPTRIPFVRTLNNTRTKNLKRIRRNKAPS